MPWSTKATRASLAPPPEYTHRRWLQQVATHHAPPLETPCFGWGSILLQSASSVPTTPGDVLAKCQRCKANSATLTGDRRVGRLAEDPKWRTLSTWGPKAWDALPAKSSCAPRTRFDLAGRDARCIEIFAGCHNHQKRTPAMRGTGGQGGRVAGRPKPGTDPPRSTSWQGTGPLQTAMTSLSARSSTKRMRWPP